METPDYVNQPDAHLLRVVAESYDCRTGSERSEAVPDTVRFLAELADGGSAVEFAVGTGRIGLPLAQAGTSVHGIDFSLPMLGELRKKDPTGLVSTTHGDMTTTVVSDDAALVYLVYNTITNLKTQDLQVACFENAAAHLRPGGCFVIENNVPPLHALSPADSIKPFTVTPNHLGFEEFVDQIDQISISHHYFIDGDQMRTSSPSFRYVWPSELDLMARIAGLALEQRWADWTRSPATNDSPSLVSVWRKLS